MYISVLQRRLYQCLDNWQRIVLNLMFDRTRMILFLDWLRWVINVYIRFLKQLGKC